VARAVRGKKGKEKGLSLRLWKKREIRRERGPVRAEVRRQKKKGEKERRRPSSSAPPSLVYMRGGKETKGAAERRVKKEEKSFAVFHRPRPRGGERKGKGVSGVGHCASDDAGRRKKRGQKPAAIREEGRKRGREAVLPSHPGTCYNCCRGQGEKKKPTSAIGKGRRRGSQ